MPAGLAPTDPKAAINALVAHLIADDCFDPCVDMAVRTRAHADSGVARVMEEADTARIASLERIFVALGCKAAEAKVRARVFYFHQVGYNAIASRSRYEPGAGCSAPTCTSCAASRAWRRRGHGVPTAAAGLAGAFAGRQIHDHARGPLLNLG